MLLAVDVGNTHIVIGAWDGQAWVGTWRLHTDIHLTEDDLGIRLRTLFNLQGLSSRIERIGIANVLPAFNPTLKRLGEKWFDHTPLFVTHELNLGLKVVYDPPHAVGADRLANAVAAMELYGLPAIVVDLGTATTLDAVSREKEYLGGAILPGVEVSLEALTRRAPRLPRIALEPPDRAVGRNTESSLRAGILLGTAGAIDTLVDRFREEIGDDAVVIATGGQSEALLKSSRTVQHSAPLITLDGIRLIEERCR